MEIAGLPVGRDYLLAMGVKRAISEFSSRSNLPVCVFQIRTLVMSPRLAKK